MDVAINNNQKELDLTRRIEEKNRELKTLLDDNDNERPDMMQIHRAARIITCISNGVNSLSEIAGYCKISKSGTFRILKAMEKANFIVYNPFSRKYLIGNLITGINSKPNINHEYLIVNSNLEMEELANISEETISLIVLSGLGQVTIRTIPSKYNLRVVEGTNMPAFSFNGAISHVLLAQVKDDELKMILKNKRPEPLTNYSITESEALISDIVKTRLQGYDISISERIIGAMCISAPIRNYLVPAALGILGPEARMKEKTSSFVKLLLDVSNRISYNLMNAFQ
ncbi:MAG: IclR family transcriptional regulator [Dehalococcoidales bacterium]|nr:IclR family transcriptional regulator [Dehalococcoidales bacterium]